MRIDSEVRVYDVRKPEAPLCPTGESIPPGTEVEALDEEMQISGRKRVKVIPFIRNDIKRYILKSELESNMDQTPTRKHKENPQRGLHGRTD